MLGINVASCCGNCLVFLRMLGTSVQLQMQWMMIALYFFRIKRDIEQILKELLVTNDTDVKTTPDKDGKVN